jgi:hypothetical protein
MVPRAYEGMESSAGATKPSRCSTL